MNETCPTEDYFLNINKHMPILAIIHGRVQIGKSTLFYQLATNISILKNSENWDYKKYCARSLNELIDMVKKYDNKILGYEECQKEINVRTWYDEFSKLFSLLLETQGYKKNIIMLVMPCGLTIPNLQRRMVNIGIEVLKKDEIHKSVMFRTTIYDYAYWRLDESNIWYGHLGYTFIKYTDEQLTRAKEYTNWLIGAKQIIMKHISDRSKLLNDQYIFEEEILPKTEKITPKYIYESFM